MCSLSSLCSDTQKGNNITARSSIASTVANFGEAPSGLPNHHEILPPRLLPALLKYAQVGLLPNLAVTSTQHAQPSAMSPGILNDNPPASGRNSPKPPPVKLWSVKEPPFEGFRPIDTEGYKQSSPSTAIIIDNGKHPSLARESPYILELTSDRLFGGARRLVLRYEA